MGWIAERADAAYRELEVRSLDRRFRVVDEVDGPFVTIDGRRLLGFCSNDYLGLAQHPAVADAARAAAEEFGWGAGASRLLSGTTRAHAELEAELARFKRADAALLYSTGFMANLGLLAGIADADTEIFSDELNHASVIDACRLSRAAVTVYPHKDVATLRACLHESRKPRRLVVTDAVFSMDGDLAPLAETVDLAREAGADVVVDDAHGTGVLGGDGRGSLEELGLEGAVSVQMGTLSKAAGSLGGFITGPRAVIDLLRSRSRPFVYTTALPAAVAAAGLEGVRRMADGRELRERLWANVRRLRERLEKAGVDLRGSRSPILSVVLGGVDRALAASARLWEAGFFLPAIRPPTVPEGQSRLRIGVTALHAPEHVDALADAVATL